MSPRKRPAPTDRPSPKHRTNGYPNDSGLPSELEVDQAVVGDASIWEALFNGQFRLAVQCDACGRWLTAGASKRAHRGPRCAARAVGE